VPEHVKPVKGAAEDFRYAPRTGERSGRRTLPSAAAFWIPAGLFLVLSCLGGYLGSRWAMGAFAAMGAEARLPDSVHAAHPSRSKTAHDLEPRYGIEP
jgi:hypothetical protein